MSGETFISRPKPHATTVHCPVLVEDQDNFYMLRPKQFASLTILISLVHRFIRDLTTSDEGLVQPDARA